MSDDGVRLFLIKICKYEIIAFLTNVWYVMLRNSAYFDKDL